MSRRKDFLPGIDMEIFQDDQMYHFNSDTVFLGSFLDLKRKDTVLDIGTNNGALLLYASRFHPQKLVGIDLFDDVIDLANENFQLHQIDATVYNSRVQDFNIDLKFDVIMCNPPYFATGKEELKNESQYLKVARHEEYLTLDELFAAVSRLLDESGRFYMVHRISDYNRILNTASKFGFFPKRMRFSYGSSKGEGKTFAIEFTRSQTVQLKLDAPCFLNEKDSFFLNNKKAPHK